VWCVLDTCPSIPGDIDLVALGAFSSSGFFGLMLYFNGHFRLRVLRIDAVSARMSVTVLCFSCQEKVDGRSYLGERQRMSLKRTRC
jgi:hypothetical protein